jgi:hypothetical protein
MSDFETAQAKLRELSPNGREEQIAALRKKLGPDRSRQIQLVAMAVVEAAKPLVAAIENL